MMTKDTIAKVTALVLYTFGLLLSLRLMIGFFYVNRNLPWTWRPDVIAQSFAGMAVLFGAVIFLQFRRSSLLLSLLGQVFVAAVLFLLCWLTHASPHYSIVFGSAHLIAVVIFTALDVRKALH